MEARWWARGFQRGRALGVVLGAIALIGVSMTATADQPGEGVRRRVGGCQTTEREYGLPRLFDSAAEAAVLELLAPGPSRKGGAACRRLGVDTAVFAQVGAVDSLPDTIWVAAAARLTGILQAQGIHVAGRSLLLHTTGTCFPPHHVDLRACADSARAAAFLEGLAGTVWPNLVVADRPQDRVLFVAAGTNLSQMDWILNLKLK